MAVITGRRRFEEVFLDVARGGARFRKPRRERNVRPWEYRAACVNAMILRYWYPECSGRVCWKCCIAGVR